MNKKLILLMLALPLILMISLFTTTSTVSLVVSVPVSKVVFNEEPIVYMDLEETYEFSYTVYPTNAANQNVIFTSEPYGNGAHAIINVQDGKIIASSCGKTKLTVTTVDGGFKDSIIVEITTNQLQGITTTVEKDTIKIGESIDVKTKFSPASAQYQTQLKYEVEVLEGEEVVTVTPQGKITGSNVGKAKIKTYCTIDNGVYDEVEVTVENTLPMEFLKKSEILTTKQTSGELKLFVDESASFTYTCEALNEEGEPYDAIEFDLNKENKTFSYEFKNQASCVITIRLKITTSEGVFEDYCEITRVGKIQCEWVIGDATGDKTKGATAIAIGQSEEVYFNLLPANKEIGYEIILSENGKYISCELKDGYLFVTSSETALDYLVGDYAFEEVTLTIWLTEEPNEKVTLTRDINIHLPS